MQELDKQIVLKNPVEIVKPVEQKQEYKFAGSFRLIPGLKLYEFSIETEEIKEVEIVKKEAFDIMKKHERSSKMAIYNPKSYYFQALNRKNAIKKVNKRIYEKTGIENYFKK